jgi:hypothetical protein
MGTKASVTSTYSVPKNKYNTAAKINELTSVLNMFRGSMKQTNLTPKKKKRK